MLDTRRFVETPEGVHLALPLAGPASRAWAWVLDVVVRFFGYVVLAIPLSFLGEAGLGLTLIVLFLGEWIYPVVFEVKRGGATPGKQSLGLVVLHDDGTPVGWTASLIRNLLRFADFLPFAYGFGLICMLTQRDFKRLGDLAAGTVVVYRETPEIALGLPTEAPPLAPPRPLLPDEQKVIIDFARRRSTWTDDRCQELADLASPLTAKRGSEGVRRLESMASWLLGRR